MALATSLAVLAASLVMVNGQALAQEGSEQGEKDAAAATSDVAVRLFSALSTTAVADVVEVSAGQSVTFDVCDNDVLSSDRGDLVVAGMQVDHVNSTLPDGFAIENCQLTGSHAFCGSYEGRYELASTSGSSFGWVTVNVGEPCPELDARDDRVELDQGEPVSFDVCANDVLAEPAEILPVTGELNPTVDQWLPVGFDIVDCMLIGGSEVCGTFVDEYFLNQGSEQSVAEVTVRVSGCNTGGGGDDDDSDDFLFEDDDFLSPIAIDMNRSGSIELSDETVWFDLDGDGDLDEVAGWFEATEGILYNAQILEDGEAVSGEHLFGDQGGLYSDGYEKLALLDLDGDGAVAGAELDGLALWFDADGDAILDEGESIPAREAGVESLATTHLNFRSIGVLRGEEVLTEDIWFQVLS